VGCAVKVGDLVRWLSVGSDINATGIIIEVIDGIEVPPVCKVLWNSGEIDKEWTDELEVINE
jgi:hypothetical protein